MIAPDYSLTINGGGGQENFLKQGVPVRLHGRSAVPQFPNGQPLPSLLSVAQSSGPLRGCSIA